MAHVHAFQLKGIVAGMFGLMGLFDAEAKANGKGSSPDSLGFSKLLSLLAPLFLPVWERPGISHMSRILRRRKRAGKSVPRADSRRGAPEHREGGIT